MYIHSYSVIFSNDSVINSHRVRSDILKIGNVSLPLYDSRIMLPITIHGYYIHG